MGTPKRITDLPVFSGTPADDDLFVIVNVSEPSSEKTCQIPFETLRDAIGSGVTGVPISAIPGLQGQLDNKQLKDDELTAVAALETDGLMTKTGAGAVTTRTITAPAAGITVTHGDGVAGNPTLALADDLGAVEALNGTGIVKRTGTSTWATGAGVTDLASTTANRLFGTDGAGNSGLVTLPAAGLTLSGGALALANDLAAVEGLGTTGLIARTGDGTAATRTITAPAAGITVTNGDGVSGNPTLALANDLAAYEGLSATGLVARTGDGTAAARTLTGPAAGITVSNGDGVSGNPTLALANDLAALEGISGTNVIPYRSGVDTWGTVTVNGGLGLTAGTLSITNATLTDLAALSPTKGNLLVGNGTNFVSIGVGTNNYVLTADSVQTTGVKWAAAPGASGGLSDAYAQVTDGTNVAGASGSDTIKFRADTGVVVTVGSNDATHGDNVLVGLHASLASIAGVTTAANKVLYATASNTFAAADFTAAGRSVVGAASASAAATALGLGTGDSPQFTAINVGDAADTTITRVSAGIVAVEGSTVALLGTEGQSLTGGASVTSKSLGTVSSGTLTLDPGGRPLQHYTNNGAHTLAPGSNTGSILLDITNGASAGAITTSGWTKVSGDSFDTTNANKFRCHASIGDAGSLLIVQAMQ